MHHYIYKIQNCKLTVAEPTIRIYARIMDCQISVPFPQRIVFAKSHHELGKDNITNLRTKPLNYCFT